MQLSFLEFLSSIIIPLVRHFTFFGQENAQNMTRYYILYFHRSLHFIAKW